MNEFSRKHFLSLSVRAFFSLRVSNWNVSLLMYNAIPSRNTKKYVIAAPNDTVNVRTGVSFSVKKARVVSVLFQLGFV